MAAAAKTPTTMPAIAPPDREEPFPELSDGEVGLEVAVAVALVVLVEDVVVVVAGGVVEATLEGMVPLFTTTYERISDPAGWLSHGHGWHV